MNGRGEDDSVSVDSGPVVRTEADVAEGRSHLVHGLQLSAAVPGEGR